MQAIRAVTQEVATAIEQAGDSANRASERVDDIATSIRQQKEAACNISQGMDQIAHMAETNMAAVEAASRAAGELTRLSTNLKSSVGWFKV